MPRTDLSYWQRLRKDSPSSWAAGLAVVASAAALLAAIGLLVPGTPTQARANPLYWALLLPFAWWGSGLAAFEPRAVRLLAPFTYAAPIIALCCLLIAQSRGLAWTPWAVATVASVLAAVGSRWSYAYSLLRREGPSR